ncbi:MAG: FtsX-like permease family protein [Defluviitaleaceae bacterium]|nr:FtsX-like permease family protein [Defluviitaleaceae bacterium]
MRITDLLSMALRNLFKRKIRTFLTVLAVIFGATCIIVMISLGVAVNMNFEQQIEAMGARALRIEIFRPWNPEPGFVNVLNDDVVAQINNLDYVNIATPLLNSSLTVMAGRYVGHLQIVGIKPEAMVPLGFVPIEGSNLTNSDELHMVFGANVPNQFMNPRNQGQNSWMMGMMGIQNDVDLLTMPLRASYRHEFGQPPQQGGGGQQGGTIRPYIVNGAGILGHGDGMDWQSLSATFMPIEQVQRIEADRERWQAQQGGGGGGSFGMWSDGMGNFGIITDQGNEGFDGIIVLANSAADLRPTVAALEEIGINPNGMWYDAQIVTSQMDTTENLQNMLLAIGVVSLIISAIGIANTMVMSIYERTKEIGVMKVIGATVKDVRRLFLLEASIIGAMGGVLGLGMSALISFVLNNLDGFELFATTPPWMPAQAAGYISFIPMWLYALGFVFSIVVGLASGFFPARRATRISALAAIRTD